MAFLGIDVGGTNTKAALLDGAVVLARAEAPTKPDGSLDAVLAAMSVSANEMLSRSEALCVALPGIVDADAGQAVFVPNLGWFEPVNVADAIERACGLRPRLVNDAVAAAMGEAYFGAGRGLESFLMLTLGTAVGAALVVDGKPYQGYRRFGGELGHIPLKHGGFPCSCGIRGCFQQYGSATALRRMARRAGLGIEQASEVFDLSAQGDERAAAVAEKYTLYLAEGAAGLVNIFRPQAVILAGGLAQIGEALRAGVEGKLFSMTYASGILGAPKVLLADSPTDAGALGAAVITAQECQ